ncbi:MAG: 50S ribosomal protein L10 [Candidatus Methanoplasma sp.]|jgi:large subunit ribosomal protein L10|nr:50S ribosomal protein L10 [Candidatus Methanoplasma sp.]
MAHVATWKKETVSEIVRDIVDNPVVAVVDVHGIPGQQIQSMRAGLRGHASVRMTKNNLIMLALDEASKSKPGLEGLKDAVHGQCAVVATEINPFKLYKKLESTMTPSAAKAGQAAPHDIVVSKGPTPFGPGPIIGELQKLGLPAAIEAGKIVIKKDTTLVKSGDPIPANVAAMLPKLEILPMIVGMDLRSAYEDGTVYGKEVLAIPDGHYDMMFATAVRNARALAIEIAYPSKETIIPLVAKAFREALGLSISAAIPTKENIELLLSKADRQMLSIASASGYSNDGISARLSSAATVAAAPAAGPAPAAKEVEQEEEKVSEEDAAAGLSALFG